MTPAAHERWRVRIPLVVIAAASWLVLAAAEQRDLAVYCDTSYPAALALDRLAFGMTLYPLGNLAWEWVLMIAAMMMPMLTGPVGHVRARSLPCRRWRALLIFMAGYWTIWLVCGVAVVTAMLAVRTIQPAPVVTAALVLAIVIAWQCSPAKQFCLNRCHGQPPLAAFGIRADVEVLKYGVNQGIWCCGTCWALMLVPLAVPGQHLVAMAATSIFLTAERMERPQRPAWALRWPSTMFRLLLFRLKQISMLGSRA